MEQDHKGVLVIDDEKAVNILLQKLLGDAGFRVVTIDFTAAGQDILEHIAKVVRESNVHTVICDLTLPGSEGSSVMNGINVIKKITSLKLGTHLLAISGTVDQNALDRLKTFNVKSAFSKSSKTAFQDIVARVKELETEPRRARSPL